MNQYTKADTSVSKIKTDYYQPENSKEFLFTLGLLLKTIFPLEVVVVHKSTMQLIANGHYLQLAIEQGKDTIEVVLADFPEQYLLHTIATHWKPTKKYAVMFKFIDVFMKYYTKKNGGGAEFRTGDKPHELRELVAEILGTNRTYLDMIEAIGNFKPELLKLVDAGQVTLKEAFAMVPKDSNKGKGSRFSNSRNTRVSSQGYVSSKNYLTAVRDTGSLSQEDLEALTENLPQHFAQEIGNGNIPSELSISKAFTYDDVLQGLSITYDQSGKSVTTNIIYTDALRASLKAA